MFRELRLSCCWMVHRRWICLRMPTIWCLLAHSTIALIRHIYAKQTNHNANTKQKKKHIATNNSIFLCFRTVQNVYFWTHHTSTCSSQQSPFFSTFQMQSCVSKKWALMSAYTWFAISCIRWTYNRNNHLVQCCSVHLCVNWQDWCKNRKNNKNTKKNNARKFIEKPMEFNVEFSIFSRNRLNFFSQYFGRF